MFNLPKEIFGFSSILVFAVGLFLLGVAILLGIWIIAKRKGRPEKGQEKVEEKAWFHFARDLAIALIVAGVVAFLVDSALNLRRLSDLFAIIYGTDVGDAVVEAVRPTVFQRDYIRENADIIVRILHDDTLLPDQAIIKVEIGYDVYSLRAGGDYNYQFQQELEHYNIKGKDRDGKELPRFDTVSVSTRKTPYEGDELQKMVEKGSLKVTDKIVLKPWPKDDTSSAARQRAAVRITTRRTEIVYVPGSYNIVVAELTKGVRVRIIEYPDDICPEIKSWYQVKAQEFENVAKDEKYNPGVILPGQSISLRFWKKPDCPDKAAGPTPAQTPKATADGGHGKGGRRHSGRGAGTEEFKPSERSPCLCD
jgi:hypothetical protein